MNDALSARARFLSAVARQALAAGARVLACKPRSKRPDTRFCLHGLKNATDSLAQVEAWLRRDDQINLSACVQKTGICVVDVDGPDGAKALEALCDLPFTRKTRTRNGVHHYFGYEGDLGGSVIKLAPELDIILSGYVMLPGSRHPDGGVYTSANFNAPIAKLPRRIERAILNHRKKPRATAAAEVTDQIPEGRRDSSLTSIAGSMRRRGYGEELILTAISAVNNEHCRPPLPDSDVNRIAASVMRYAPADDGLFESMANVTPRSVDFLWEPYLVRGAVNLLEGDPNTGKTYLLCKITAAVTAGENLPGQQGAKPRNVLFMSAEDDPETTLVRRFKRMGADLKRITFATKFFRLEEEALGWIEKHVVDNGVELVILDPLVAYMQGGIDLNKANETRPFMARLAELAKNLNITVIALRHLTKGDRDKAIFRGLGSIDITASARSVILLGEDPEDPALRAMVHIKHNLSERGPTQLFELTGASREWGRVPRLTWRGTSDLGPDDFARHAERPGRPDTLIADAREYLRQALADGPMPIKSVVVDGEKRGFSPRTLRRARIDLGATKHGQKWELARTPP